MGHITPTKFFDRLLTNVGKMLKRGIAYFLVCFTVLTLLASSCRPEESRGDGGSLQGKSGEVAENAMKIEEETWQMPPKGILIQELPDSVPGFACYELDTLCSLGEGKEVRYLLRFDYPVSGHPQELALNEWVVSKVLGSMCYENEAPNYYSLSLGGYERRMGRRSYRGDRRRRAVIGRFMAHRLFTAYKDEYERQGEEGRARFLPETTYQFNFRVLKASEHWITYLLSTWHHEGGTPPFYTERLFTFDVERRRELTKGQLFKSGVEPEVWPLLIGEMAHHQHFLSRTGIEEGDTAAVMRHLLTYEGEGTSLEQLQMHLPGITEKGLVFSYQPYEIAPHEAGVIHFMIPFEAVMPYLTERAKRFDVE